MAPVADDNVSETSSTDKQATSSVTESVTTMTSATGEQAAAGTQNSEKSEKMDNLEPGNKRLDTYMKPNQCVCGFEAKSASELKIHHGFQHPEKSFRCFGLVANDNGKTIKCPFETDDEGQMWCHYRTPILVFITIIVLMKVAHMVQMVAHTELTRLILHGNTCMKNMDRRRQPNLFAQTMVVVMWWGQNIFWNGT